MEGSCCGRPRRATTTSSSRRTSSETDNWTTLPDLNGNTSTAVPTECEADFLINLHPNLERYLTPGDPCVPAFPGIVELLHG